MGNRDIRSLSLAELKRLGKSKAIENGVEKIARDGNVFPQSAAQQGQWFTDQMSIDCIYNVPMSYLLEGEIDIDRMEQAISKVIMNQESMRTIFRIVDDVPSQVIEEYKPFKLERYDFSKLSEDKQHEEVSKLIKEVAQTHFDLKVYPLWRFALITLSDTKHVFTFTLHHIISDGWSFRVLFNEMLSYYKNDIDIKHDIQYVDYTLWQKKRLETDALLKKRDFWKQYLEGATHQISLARDIPADDNATHKGGNLFITISEEVTAKLRKFAQDEHVTVFHVLLAVYFILLHYASGDLDINIGTPYVNRNRREFEKLIGLFMNTFVIRQKINPKQSFLTFLSEVGKNAMSAEENAEVPIEQVVADLNIDRRGASSPLFQCLFVFMDVSGSRDDLSIEGVDISPIDTDTGTAQFDYSIYTTAQDKEIDLRVEYNSDLFLAETAKKMIDTYLGILNIILEEPQRSINEIVGTFIPMKYDVTISSTFVPDMLKESSNLWCKKLALPLNLKFAPYSQIFQELYLDDSQMRKNEYGFNIFLIRPEDWGQGKGKSGVENIESNVKEFIERVNEVDFDIHSIYICPASKEVEDSEELSNCIETQTELIKRKIDKCIVVDTEELANKYQLSKFRDDESNMKWHIPYTKEFYGVLGTDIMLDIFKKTMICEGENNG